MGFNPILPRQSSNRIVAVLFFECDVLKMIRVAAHLSVFLLLTILTQIGGLAWIVALCFRRRLIAFCLIYAVLTLAAIWVAPQFGRVALNCFDNGPLQVQSWMYCALNRNYVDPELRDILTDAATDMDAAFPGTKTLVLDANFPFLNGFPLLPHLSHDDGGKVDLALYYQDEKGYLPGATRSPIGYFAFEQGPTSCPRAWPSLRWDLAVLQPLWRDFALENARSAAILNLVTKDVRAGKIFLEPHLARTLDVSHPNMRFQGCRAARHDDHIHVQLR